MVDEAVVEMIIGKEKYSVRNCEIEQSKLKFFPENPRVYSILNSNGACPEQSEIENLMCQMDHVKQLKESIKTNGGLIDAVLVRDGDFVVLEGNSRLAAYRLLYRQDPIKWSKIKAIILPGNIPNSAIFTLIGQYHIIGRKDWSPYEQAGYLYRTMNSSGKSANDLADELGLTLNNINGLVRVYEYMLHHNDDHSNKWSYYEELLKNASIKKSFSQIEGLEEKIVEQIKNNELNMALDIRDLGNICKVNDKLSKKILKDIVEGEETIYSGYEIIQSSGKLDNNYQLLSNFRKKITDENFDKKLLKDENPQQIKFELSKINKTVSMLLKKMESDKQ